MQRLVYRNKRGATVNFDAGAPFVFWKVDGLQLPSAQPSFTRSPGQSGYSLREVTLEARIVKVTMHVHGKDRDYRAAVEKMYALRRHVQSVCNPLLGAGELYYSNDAGDFMIPAFLKDASEPLKIGYFTTMELSFECPSPFWLLADESVVKLAYIEGGLKFPAKLTAHLGTLGYRAVIDNDGGAVTPIEMLIDGGSLNPVVQNKTTGQIIKVSRQINGGEKLYINTDPEKLAIRLITIDPETNEPTEENAFGYLTDDSDLFQLVAGVNVLTFTSDDQNNKVSIKITFRKRYVGV